MNDIMDVQLRKYNRNIEISGVAIMVFAVWDVLKDVLSVFFGTESLETFLGYSVEDVENGRIIRIKSFLMNELNFSHLLQFLYVNISTTVIVII